MDEMSFPRIETKNHAVKLSQPGERSVRSKHPWIFETSIEKIGEEITAGDRAIIFDKKKNKLMGIGLIDPFSPIRIKMVSYGKKASLDQTWFNAMFLAAYNKRIPLLETDTNSFRLIFGENDSLPGLIIDIYDHVAVMKWYSLIWLPYADLLVEAILSINNLQSEQKKNPIDTIVLRLSRNVEKQKEILQGIVNGQVIHGVLENEVVIFTEHGVKFSANVIKGHKTGYFLDHRDNRRKVGRLAKGRKVLDVFSYAGGFSVHALVGGASEVTSIDISKQALKLAKYNGSLNGEYNNHQIIAGDAFYTLQKLNEAGEEYDLIVIDPPSFAKQASEIPTAKKSYVRLAKIAIQLAAKDAIIVMASCSSRVQQEEFEDIILNTFDRYRRRYTILESTTHDVDHPIGFPEGAYLKSIYVRIDS